MCIKFDVYLLHNLYNQNSKLMEKVKMTIHRALSELKLIDAKIEKQITEIIPTGAYQKGKLINGYIQEEDFKKSAESKYASINDLILRKSLIKSLIVKANGETKVTISKKEMSIADAITAKTTIKFKKQFVEELKKRHQQTIVVLNKNNNQVEQNIQSILEATFGKENVKVGKEDVDAVRKPYIEANEFHLFDPLKVTEKIESIETEIIEFESEVDAVLSEINAITLIEV